MRRLAIGAAVLSLCGEAQAQDLPPMAEQAVQLRRAYAFLDRCKGEAWMSAVLNAEFTRSLAQLAVQAPAAVPPTNVAATQAEAADAAVACDSAQGRQLRRQVAEMTDVLAANWVVRMQGMLTASGANPWAAEITSLAPHAARINALGAQVAAIDPAAYAQAQASAVNEASIVLRLVCADRRTVRSASPRACPEIPAQDRSSAPIATALIVGAERIAPLLPGPTTAAPAAGVGEFFAWRPANAPAWDGRCNPRDLVIRPSTDRAEGFSSLLRFGGDIARYGEVYVLRDSARYAVVDMDEDARKLGVDKSGSFQQCRS